MDGLNSRIAKRIPRIPANNDPRANFPRVPIPRTPNRNVNQLPSNRSGTIIIENEIQKNAHKPRVNKPQSSQEVTLPSFLSRKTNSTKETTMSIKKYNQIQSY